MVISNGAGSVTSSFADVTVRYAPSVIVHPVDVNGTEGDTNATISVQAQGTSPINYQWQKQENNGTWSDINGATGNAYILPFLKVADQGQYRVQLSNLVGTVFSKPATITVTAAAPGTKLWEFVTGDFSTSPAIGTNGTVYFGSGNGKVYARNA